MSGRLGNQETAPLLWGQVASGERPDLSRA